MIDNSRGFIDKSIEKMNLSRSKLVVGLICLALVMTGAYYAIDYVDAEEVRIAVVSMDETTDEVQMTRARTVGEFLDANGITVGEKDLCVPGVDEKITNEIKIVLKRGFDVKINQKGEEKECYGWPGTVAETLEANGIAADGDDVISPALTEEVKPGMSILVKIVTKEEIVKTETVKYSTKYSYDKEIDVGEVITNKEGVDGEKEVTYEVTYEDEVEVYREAIAEVITIEAIPEQLTIGTKGAYAAPDAGEGTINGEKYTRMYTDVKAYAYYMGVKPIGASGNPCTRGTCAVDPKVIPLGTKLFIEGYGYAIANDTGGDIKGKTVDLYMNSTDECFKWGVRYVNVYVLE